MANRNWEIIKTTNPRRIYNYSLLKLSFHLSNIFKKPIHWGYPIAISIEPTTACNLKCPECPSGLRSFTRPTGNLKKDVNQKVLEALGKNLQFINYYFQGEPFIHPNFLELVKEARKKNIYVLTSTNAHFLSEKKAHEIIESGLNELIISIDGTTQETYENYRIEGELKKVLEGIQNISQAKKDKKSNLPLVTLQFLVTRQNEHQINEIKALKNKYGADRLNLKTIQVYDYENGNDLIPENENYSRYSKGEDGKLKLKNKFKNQCWRMWSTCVFTWDAKIVPCCFDKDAQYQMGELSQTSFKEIWKSKIYHEFRQKVLLNRQSIDICTNCSEGSKIEIS